MQGGELVRQLSTNGWGGHGFFMSGATLSRWMGANDNEIDRIFPDQANFYTHDPGFMQSQD